MSAQKPVTPQKRDTSSRCDFFERNGQCRYGDVCRYLHLNSHQLRELTRLEKMDDEWRNAQYEKALQGPKYKKYQGSRYMHLEDEVRLMRDLLYLDVRERQRTRTRTWWENWDKNRLQKEQNAHEAKEAVVRRTLVRESKKTLADRTRAQQKGVVLWTAFAQKRQAPAESHEGVGTAKDVKLI